MLTIDLESGYPLFLEANGRILEEGSIVEPLRLESGYRLLLQSNMAILEEASFNTTYLNLESGVPLFTESLVRFVV